jgi:outer membrane receptor protein involved in Fe transport
MNVFPGGRDSTDRQGEITRRTSADWLWSANLTWRLGGRTNLRLAASRTVARPDAREVSPDAYVAVTGDCDFGGNPAVQHTSVTNGDARLEVYPSPGEILAVSGFYKRFIRPIIEFVSVPGGGQCRVFFGNGLNASNYGAEFEVRKRLGRFFAGGNVTLVRSRVTIDPELGTYDPHLALQGQSPVLVNGNLGYVDPGARLEITLLANYFADRVARYGTSFGVGVGQAPNNTERGRFTLDAKGRVVLGRHLGITLSGRNLTNTLVEFVNEAPSGIATVGRYRPGVDVTLGVSYDF